MRPRGPVPLRSIFVVSQAADFRATFYESPAVEAVIHDTAYRPLEAFSCLRFLLFYFVKV